MGDQGEYVGKRVRVVGNVTQSVKGSFTLVAADGVKSVTITIPDILIEPAAMPIVEVLGTVGDDLSVAAELVCPFTDLGLLLPIPFFCVSSVFHPSLISLSVCVWLRVLVRLQQT